ncbi:MAG TPA: portal protein [Burkholderiaceae bacterium]
MAASTENHAEKIAERGVKLPKADGGQNKLAPTALYGGKGGKGDDKLSLEEEQKLLTRARKRMVRCIEYEAKDRADALDDLNFYNGKQWPDDIAAQRTWDKRPCLTVNKLPVFVKQITNDTRQNRPEINVQPMGDKGDKEGAAILRGMIRAIERDCAADIAYDTGQENQVRIGFGYWRIVTEYENPDTFDKVLAIRRIRNPFTVYLDPDRQAPEGADMQFAFITEMMPRDEFEDRYPGAQVVPWTESGIGEDMKLWTTKDQVRIAEYFEIEKKPRRLVRLGSGHVGWYDELDRAVKAAIDSGYIEILQERESMCPKVMWYVLTAIEVLKKREWPGQWIPIIECQGDDIDIQGKLTRKGVVRNSKDAQRMYNYWVTAEAEQVALIPKAPYVMEEGQVEGHEAEWRQANVKNFPYLTYKGVNIAGRQAPPPSRNAFSGPPAAVVQAKAGAAEDMQATTGVRFDATKGERLFDESGRALRELKRVTDIGSFHFPDNYGRSLRWTGVQLVDLIPKVYDTQRVVTILREDGKDEQVRLSPSMGQAVTQQPNTEGNAIERIFNPKFGRYGVTVTLGPSYASKRIEAADSMMAFAKAMPQVGMLVADLIAKNQDWPGAEEMAKRLAKALPPNLLAPEQKDLPPQAQAMLAALQQQVQQLTAERQSLIAQLTDRAADRKVLVDKANQDFEAKIMAVMQKAQDSMNENIGDKLVASVAQIEQKFKDFHAQQQLGEAQRAAAAAQQQAAATGGAAPGKAPLTKTGGA